MTCVLSDIFRYSTGDIQTRKNIEDSNINGRILLK